jgi:TatD DNase family protein
MPLIDSHSHIDNPRFDPDRLEVIERAKIAGVSRQIVPAIQSKWWSRLKACCDSDDSLFPAYGLHPLYISQYQANDLLALETWLQSEPAIAVGECGLDYYNVKYDQERQLFYFEAQLGLAQQFELPVIIHARHSVEDVIHMLQNNRGVYGVLHSYSGSYEQAVKLIDLGFMLGFGGPVTSPHAKRLQRIIKRLPLDAMILETDSPDQPDFNHLKERNEPAYLSDVALFISNLIGIEASKLASTTSNNAEQLFNLPSVE